MIAEGKDPDSETADDSSNYAGKVLIATVKGDVHDIGKNIVAVVLGCNNFLVKDIGVMQPWEKIKAAIEEFKPDVIGLSGLITPSLDEMVMVAKELRRGGYNIPILIGGATTSEMHTAVKISPCFSTAEHPVVHVLDASRAVTVVRSLISVHDKQDYAEDVLERYQEMRDEYNATVSERKCLALKAAQAKRCEIDFVAQPPAPAPKQMGVTILDGYTVEDVIPYIDWEPFFMTWDLKGRYPNKSFPNIFKDERVGAEAKKTYDDAQDMIKEMVASKMLTLKGVVGLFAANRSEDGEDVEVFEDAERTKVAARFCMLRQQIVSSDASERHMSQADFIAPRGHADHFGMFAVACMGADELADKYKDNKDDFSRIMVQALADRFVEAFAELVHKDIRMKLWGYAPDEQLKQEDLLKVRYSGIRPAPGYPSQPDHTEKKTMWDLLQVEAKAGIKLSETLAMLPAASVSAFVYAHPASRYFAVDKVEKDQVESYAQRKGMSVLDVERWLNPILNYQN